MSDFCPGAVQVPQPGGVTLDTSLPPRFVWHITWDALDANGKQPNFSAVANYLQGEEYCPHIMWNPFTGYMEQYYPASVGSRALMYNDQDGAACVQVEIFFTPGCVVDGTTYNTVADTPLIGFDTLLAWADRLGVPRTWPMGAPQWQGNSRDIATWNNNAGHYGHCHSPGDTHTDPGPMPDLNRGVAAMGTITPEELFTVGQYEDLSKKLDNIAGYLVYGYNSAGKAHPSIADAIDGIPGRVWGTTVNRGGKPVPALQELADAKTAAQWTAGKPVPAVDVKALAVEVAALIPSNQAHDFIVALGQALPKE